MVVPLLSGSVVGKRVQFDEETWEAIDALARSKGKTFQQLTDEAYADLLKKHKQPVGLMESLRESVQTRSRPKRRRTSS
jgi:hypothetical protein